MSEVKPRSLSSLIALAPVVSDRDDLCKTIIEQATPSPSMSIRSIVRIE